MKGDSQRDKVIEVLVCEERDGIRTLLDVLHIGEALLDVFPADDTLSAVGIQAGWDGGDSPSRTAAERLRRLCAHGDSCERVGGIQACSKGARVDRAKKGLGPVHLEGVRRTGKKKKEGGNVVVSCPF